MRTRRSSVFFRFTSAFFSSRSTATLIVPGVSHTLGPIVLTGNGPLWSSTFEHTEIRVAEACLARVQALLRTSRQGLKGLPEHQPDTDPRYVLHFVCVLFASFLIILLMSILLISIYSF